MCRACRLARPLHSSAATSKALPPIVSNLPKTAKETRISAYRNHTCYPALPFSHVLATLPKETHAITNSSHTTCIIVPDLIIYGVQ